MKTSYSEIVNENYIGKTENPIPMNEILKKANEEKLEPSSSSLEKVLFWELMCNRTSWITER